MTSPWSRRSAGVLAGLLLASPAAAQPAAPLTLDGARALAVQRAITVEQAAARADAAQAAAVGVRAGALPTVTASAAASLGAGFTAFGFPRPVQRQASIGLGASWVLVAPATWGAATAARRTADGRAAMADWARVEARASATTAFTAAHAAAEAREARVRAREQADEIARTIAVLVKQGLRAPAELIRAHADVATARAAEATARAAADARCAELLALLRTLEGAPVCALEAPALESATPGPGPTQHPALAAAALSLEAATATRASAAWSYAPTLTVDGSAAWYRADEGGGPGWSAGAQLDLPVFASGATQSGVDQSTALREEARLALEGETLRLRAALASAESRLVGARDALRAQLDALEASNAALSLVEVRYRSGVDDLTTLLAARAAWETAAVATAGARAELGAALAAVEAARGVTGP